MSNALTRLFQRQSMRASVRRALESGVGLYRTTWQIEPGTDAQTSDDLASDLIAWSREVLSQMHRPYGLDYVTLALSAHGEGDAPAASVNFGIVRPQDFYDEGPAEDQIRTTLHRWADTQILGRCQGGRLSAVLFSWGDLTRELLLAG